MPVNLTVAPGGARPGLLDLADAVGDRVLETACLPGIGLRAETRPPPWGLRAGSPSTGVGWSSYPDMNPLATLGERALLEHPEQAFAAYRSEGLGSVVCQQKHMGPGPWP